MSFFTLCIREEKPRRIFLASTFTDCTVHARDRWCVYVGVLSAECCVAVQGLTLLLAIKRVARRAEPFSRGARVPLPVSNVVLFLPEIWGDISNKRHPRRIEHGCMAHPRTPHSWSCARHSSLDAIDIISAQSSRSAFMASCATTRTLSLPHAPFRSTIFSRQITPRARARSRSRRRRRCRCRRRRSCRPFARARTAASRRCAHRSRRSDGQGRRRRHSR